MSFGYGAKGRLGHGGRGDMKSQHTPKLIEALRGKKGLQVSAGGHHSLVLTDDGAVRSFGHGAKGQLGHLQRGGSLAGRSIPKSIGGGLKGKKVVQVSAGAFHSLVLLESGGVMAFGCTDQGRLGFDHKGGMWTRPKLIEALRGKKVLQVSAGDNHSLVLLEGGGVMAFGDGKGWQLGDENGANQPLPELIEAAQGMRMVEVSAGCRSSVLLGISGELKGLWAMLLGALSKGGDA